MHVATRARRRWLAAAARPRSWRRRPWPPIAEAAAQLLAIIEPHAGEIAANLGPVAAYVGRLASLLGRHDLAERYLSSALEIVETFGWDYHRASVLIFLAGCRRRRLGELDTQAHASLDQAARICTAHGLSRLLVTIDEMRP